MNRIEELTAILGLEPHPEGGFFRETYRSEGLIPSGSLPKNFDGDRNYSTGIYFLLTSGFFSAFHRIKQDEMWHFYEGSPVTIHMITENGGHSTKKIGLDLTKGEVPQFTVPKNTWFASEVTTPDSYALVGCTVSPGFDFADFELADGEALSKAFPDHAKLINRLTR